MALLTRAGATERVEPADQAELPEDDRVSYLIAHPTEALRDAWQRDIARRTARLTAELGIDEGLKVRLQGDLVSLAREEIGRLVDPSQHGTLFEVLDAWAEHLEENPDGAALPEDLSEEIGQVQSFLRRNSDIWQDAEEDNGLMVGVMIDSAVARFVLEIENGPPANRVRGRLTAETLDAIPDAHKGEIYAAAMRLLRPTEQEAKN